MLEGLQFYRVELANDWKMSFSVSDEELEYFRGNGGLFLFERMKYRIEKEGFNPSRAVVYKDSWTWGTPADTKTTLTPIACLI
jgi:hypothetical protein